MTALTDAEKRRLMHAIGPTLTHADADMLFEVIGQVIAEREAVLVEDRPLDRASMEDFRNVAAEAVEERERADALAADRDLWRERANINDRMALRLMRERDKWKGCVEAVRALVERYQGQREPFGNRLWDDLRAIVSPTEPTAADQQAGGSDA